MVYFFLKIVILGAEHEGRWSLALPPPRLSYGPFCDRPRKRSTRALDVSFSTCSRHDGDHLGGEVQNLRGPEVHKRPALKLARTLARAALAAVHLVVKLVLALPLTAQAVEARLEDPFAGLEGQGVAVLVGGPAAREAHRLPGPRRSTSRPWRRSTRHPDPYGLRSPRFRRSSWVIGKYN